MAAEDAKVQLLHGVPGIDTDVYVDGEAIAAEFGSGSVAGPIELDPGSHAIALFAASSSVPASSDDRTDDSLATSTLQVGSKPASLVAHFDESGDISLSVFSEDLRPLDPGAGRVNLRHLMEAETVDSYVDGELVATLGPGEELAVEVGAGSILVEFKGEDGTVMTAATVVAADGELASLSAIGSPADETAEIVIQRYSGLSTAPAGVPTGNSGLLGGDEDTTGLRMVYGLMIVLMASGVVVMLRRRAAS